MTGTSGAADCSFKDLCLDGVDARTLSAFWGEVLGKVAVGEGGGSPDMRLDDPRGNGGGLVWINQVPERHEVKTRVHLDLRLPLDDPAPLVALGAQVLREPGGDVHWWVLADPEGNEFCAFGPGPWPAPARPEPFELVVDSVDPAASARWWAERTGGTAVVGEKPWSWIEGAAGFPYRYWVFAPVPEPKTVKNRLHWDVRVPLEDPSGLVAAGARVLAEPSPDSDWWVMADPEGNEFCAFTPAQA